MAHGVQTSWTVQSNDGTAIAFDREGHVPPVIFVGGALNSAVRDSPPFVELARLLEPRFTIYRFDRRGRGDSGDVQPYAFEREAQDLQEAGEAADGIPQCVTNDSLDATTAVRPSIGRGSHLVVLPATNSSLAGTPGSPDSKDPAASLHHPSRKLQCTYRSASIR